MRAMILAVDLQWGIGRASKENGLPWESIPEDFKHFQKITKKYVRVLMGKKTWEAIFKLLGKPLPGRENNILSTTMKESPHPETKVFSSVKEFHDYIKSQDYCVIGGAKTYKALAQYADEIILTKVHGTFPADCWFDVRILDDFSEDLSKKETLREVSEGKPAVTVHYYVKHK